NREQNQLRTRLEWLEGCLKTRKASLDRMLATRRRLAQDVGAQNAQTLARAYEFVIERLSMVQKELIRVRSDLTRAKVEAVVEEKVKILGQQPIPDEVVDEQLKKEPWFEAQRQKIARLEKEFETVKRISRDPNAPIVLRAKSAVQDAKKALAE